MRRRIGTGQRGRPTAGPSRPSSPSRRGCALLPPHVAEVAGYDVVVADTVNHLLRGPEPGRRLGHDGRRHRQPVALRPGRRRARRDSVDLSSPWDVAWYDDKVIIAMAGIHQLWWFDPVKRTAGRLRRHDRRGAAGRSAGRGVDGPAVRPVGRAAAGCGSPTASRRRCAASATARCTPRSARACSTSGLMDGPAETALFQHPLGVCARCRTDRCWSPTRTTARSG